MPGTVPGCRTTALTKLMYLEPSNKQTNAKYSVRKLSPVKKNKAGQRHRDSSYQFR